MIIRNIGKYISSQNGFTMRRGQTTAEVKATLLKL